MRRQAKRKISRRRSAGQRKTGTLKVFAILFLAISFLPWQNTLSFVPLIPAADAATERPGSIGIATLMPDVIGLPVRLKIPRIKVNAVIEQAGLKKDGSMDTPKLPKNTAWFRLGPKPGEIGSAVIAGHVSWWTGASSAFANLSKVKPGDLITVQDDKGAVIVFKVRQLKRMDAAADATSVFVSTDGKAHLNLVTCVGAWNKKTRQYSQRLVVFADKVE